MIHSGYERRVGHDSVNDDDGRLDCASGQEVVKRRIYGL